MVGGILGSEAGFMSAGRPKRKRPVQSYAIQRYMTACAGRGAQPIKFNGSLFTVGHDLPDGESSTEENHDPDYRAWGNSFWNQNTRLIYWPLIATGDNDLLAPGSTCMFRRFLWRKIGRSSIFIMTAADSSRRFIFGDCRT